MLLIVYHVSSVTCWWFEWRTDCSWLKKAVARRHFLYKYDKSIMWEKKVSQELRWFLSFRVAFEGNQFFHFLKVLPLPPYLLFSLLFSFFLYFYLDFSCNYYVTYSYIILYTYITYHTINNLLTSSLPTSNLWEIPQIAFNIVYPPTSTPIHWFLFSRLTC